MNKNFILIIFLPILISCTSEIPMVNLGIDDKYYIPRMSKLPLESALTGAEYLWTVDGEVVSTDHSYIFIAQEEGIYNLSFDIIDDNTPYHFESTIGIFS